MYHIYRLDPVIKKIWYSHSETEESRKSGWLSGCPIQIDVVDNIYTVIENATHRNRWIVSKELIKYEGEDGHIVDVRIAEKYKTKSHTAN